MTDVLHALHRQGALSTPALRRALALTVGTPPARRWRPFLSKAALILGGASLLAGAIYFFAYNWESMPRVLRFGVLEAGLAGAALWPLLRPRTDARPVALAFAAVLMGPLLAVYGQEYQTGADPWELFAGWVVLALPFALAARWTPLNVLLGALANVALWRWFDERGFDLPAYGETLAHAVLNGALALGFGLLAKNRWPARIFALGSLAPVVLLGTLGVAFPHEMVSLREGAGPAVVPFAVASSVALVLAVRRDFFFAALGAAGGCVLLHGLLWRALDRLPQLCAQLAMSLLAVSCAAGLVQATRAVRRRSKVAA